jgi:hypothetical protein
MSEMHGLEAALERLQNVSIRVPCGLQTSLVVHPLYHSFYDGFCHCLSHTQRISYWTRPGKTWLDRFGYHKPGPKDTSVFVTCIDKVDAELFKVWIVFPGAIVVLLLICCTQVPEASVLWNRYNSTFRKKQQHDPCYLIIQGDSCIERNKLDPEWCAVMRFGPAGCCNVNSGAHMVP